MYSFPESFLSNNTHAQFISLLLPNGDQKETVVLFTSANNLDPRQISSQNLEIFSYQMKNSTQQVIVPCFRSNEKRTERVYNCAAPSSPHFESLLQHKTTQKFDTTEYILQSDRLQRMSFRPVDLLLNKHSIAAAIQELTADFSGLKKQKDLKRKRTSPLHGASYMKLKKSAYTIAKEQDVVQQLPPQSPPSSAKQPPAKRQKLAHTSSPTIKEEKVMKQEVKQSSSPLPVSEPTVKMPIHKEVTLKEEPQCTKQILKSAELSELAFPQTMVVLISSLIQQHAVPSLQLQEQQKQIDQLKQQVAELTKQVQTAYRRKEIDLNAEPDDDEDE